MDLGYEYATYFDMAYFVIPSFYYSPPVSDNYHDIGVFPHHTVELSEEAKEYYLVTLPEELDNQLQAALAFIESDTPLSPAPTDELPPEGSEQPNGTNPSNPSIGDTKDSDTVLFVFLGIFTAAAIAVIVYIVIDYRRRANHVRPPYHPPQDSDEN